MNRFGGRKIRFGIVGCGAIGPTHAGALQQLADVELIAVADVDFTRAQTLASRFSLSRVYRDQSALLADPEVDVVCLCTPSGLHGSGAIDALQAGKDVIVEKPMEISVAACQKMIAAQTATGKRLGVISQHRFDAASLQVKHLIQSGKLGRILLATADVKWFRTQKYYDEGDWRGTITLDGGGAVMNQGIHTLDLLQWFVGEVESVYAQVRTAGHERIEVEDSAVATLSFKSGAIGSYVASTAAYDGQPARLDIFGTEGSAILEGDCLKELKLKTGEHLAHEPAAPHAVQVARGGTASVTASAGHRAAVDREGAVWGDAHAAQIRDFVNALRTDTCPMIDGPAGLAPVRIIEALYQSARSNALVKLTSV